VLALELDVRSDEEIEQAVGKAFSTLGGLECLVNNAGVALRAHALDVTRAQWDDVLSTNLSGAFFLSRAVARRWLEAQASGAIVQMASTHGLVGFATRSVYGISKGAMIQMVRMLAIEWAQYNIRVNAIAPGTVLTESRAVLAADPLYRETMLNRVPLKRFASLEDVAAAVCYLASPQASYITGQTLVLDGGLTAQ
jgi:NAD(P)-dependent dehydrogenase (short-subunit alcohol dehydrogenase family)